jgi:hypothetical protein
MTPSFVGIPQFFERARGGAGRGGVWRGVDGMGWELAQVRDRFVCRGGKLGRTPTKRRQFGEAFTNWAEK